MSVHGLAIRRGTLDGVEPSDLLLAGTTLAASFGGYFLAGLNEARRDRRAADHERQSRAEDARLRRDEDRHRLQLEALMALQEDVQLAIRQCGKTLHFDHMQARRGEYTQLPEAWSEADLANWLNLRRNGSRILDDDVRASVDELDRVTTDLVMIPKKLMGLSGNELEVAALSNQLELSEIAERVNGVIGSAIRRELAWEPVDRS